jgi:hypothetical protein
MLEILFFGSLLEERNGSSCISHLIPRMFKIITTEIHPLGIESKEEKTANIVEE